MYETSLVMGACQAFFIDEICDDLDDLLSNPNDFCSSDKRWNMINIRVSVIAAWSFSWLGLKCLGIGPKGSQSLDTPGSINDSLEKEWEVEVEFHWLYLRFRKPNEEMDIITDENDMKNMVEAQLKHEKEGCPPFIGASDIATGSYNSNPIFSGNTFTTTMSEEDAHKFKMMLDLRWFIISIAAMSGAAGYPELLPSPLER